MIKVKKMQTTLKKLSKNLDNSRILQKQSRTSEQTFFNKQVKIDDRPIYVEVVVRGQLLLVKGNSLSTNKSYRPLVMLKRQVRQLLKSQSDKINYLISLLTIKNNSIQLKQQKQQISQVQIEIPLANQIDKIKQIIHLDDHYKSGKAELAFKKQKSKQNTIQDVTQSRNKRFLIKKSPSKSIKMLERQALQIARKSQNDVTKSLSPQLLDFQSKQKPVLSRITKSNKVIPNCKREQLTHSSAAQIKDKQISIKSHNSAWGHNSDLWNCSSQKQVKCKSSQNLIWNQNILQNDQVEQGLLVSTYSQHYLCQHTVARKQKQNSQGSAVDKAQLSYKNNNKRVQFKQQLKNSNQNPPGRFKFIDSSFQKIQQPKGKMTFFKFPSLECQYQKLLSKSKKHKNINQFDDILAELPKAIKLPQQQSRKKCINRLEYRVNQKKQMLISIAQIAQQQQPYSQLRNIQQKLLEMSHYFKRNQDPSDKNNQQTNELDQVQSVQISQRDLEEERVLKNQKLAELMKQTSIKSEKFDNLIERHQPQLYRLRSERVQYSANLSVKLQRQLRKLRQQKVQAEVYYHVSK